MKRRRCAASLTLLALTALLLHGPAALAEDTSSLPRLVNESGKIMVLMYHGVGDRDGTWVRSRDGLRRDLEVLYAKGYRPIRLIDYVANRITTAAGMTPVVFTFDDGRKDNFTVQGSGADLRPAADSAVGILEAFGRVHTDFPIHATFFLSGRVPFGERDSVTFKVRYLVAHGLDVGNHTTGHQNLALPAMQSASVIQKAIGQQAAFLEALVEGGYTVDSYALCHGARPKTRELRDLLVAGSYGGKRYRNLAVLNVGSGPAPAPTSAAFNPASIPRIRAADPSTTKMGLYHWLDWFDAHPEERFVSDGDPLRTTTPAP